MAWRRPGRSAPPWAEHEDPQLAGHCHSPAHTQSSVLLGVGAFVTSRVEVTLSAFRPVPDGIVRVFSRSGLERLAQPGPSVGEV